MPVTTEVGFHRASRYLRRIRKLIFIMGICISNYVIGRSS